MFTLKIQQEAKRAGIQNAYQLQVQAKLSPAVASELWKGKTIPKLQTLDRLCEVFGCELWDLVIWKPKANGRR